MRGHAVESQRSFPGLDREQLIGTLIPDLIVDGLIVVDPKTVESFSDSHVAQMLAISPSRVSTLLSS